MGDDPIPRPLDALREWFEEATRRIRELGRPEKLKESSNPGRRSLAERILDAIPYDKWVTSAEVAAETGISSRRVGALIGQHLLTVDVERRPSKRWKGGHYLYRRLHRWGASGRASRGELR